MISLQATTEIASHEGSMIARSGRLSLFTSLQECCPSAVRNDDPFIGRHGMTEIEFNKVLEKHGFTKVRDRTAERGSRGDELCWEAEASNGGQKCKTPKGSDIHDQQCNVALKH